MYSYHESHQPLSDRLTDEAWKHILPRARPHPSRSDPPGHPLTPSGRAFLSALEQQRRLNELRARVVALASREFRGPLATIGSAQQRLRDDGLAPSDRLQALDAIDAATQRMAGLLDRVGVLARVDGGLLA